MEKHPLIRKIYLYVASFLGLVLVVIAGVQLVNLGLKVYVFTQIDRQESSYQKMPPAGPFLAEKVGVLSGATAPAQLTEEERTAMKSWLESYKSWQEEQKSFDLVTANRQRDASISLALLIIGLPLYFYHWRVVKKESKLS